MNKTININIGGYFFHIDEDAYLRLNKYLNAVRNSLSDDPLEKKEIMNDIESRISELLSEKQHSPNKVINDNQIGNIIEIMGQPKDYDEYNESDKNTEKPAFKKLLRDKDDRFLGGVSSGIGHYINISPLWIRLFFLIITLAGFGSGILAYIILWILVPSAKTTAEKLQMKGSPVNIDNIQKKIQQDLSQINETIKDSTDKIVNLDYETVKKSTQTFLNKLIHLGSHILQLLFKGASKIIAVFLIIFSGTGILAILFTAISINNTNMSYIKVNGINVEILSLIPQLNLPIWLTLICITIASIIPLIALFLIGIRIISKNSKRTSVTTNLILLGIWFISLFCLSFTAISYYNTYGATGMDYTNTTLNYDNSKTIHIGFEDIDKDNNLTTTESLKSSHILNVNGENMKYSNNISLQIKQSKDTNTYIEILKKSKGREGVNSIDNAKNIKYKLNLNGNKLNLDAYFISNIKNIITTEEVSLTLYVVKGSVIDFEESTRHFLSPSFKLTEKYSIDEILNNDYMLTETGLIKQ